MTAQSNIDVSRGGFLRQVVPVAPFARFRITLLVLGIAPLVIVPTVLASHPLPADGIWNTSFVFFTGVLHIGMTLFFYVDPQMRAYRRAHPAVFVAWPLVIGVTTAIAVTVLPAAGATMVEIAFAVWLAHHYTGQQVGVVNLVLKSDVGTTKLAHGERRFIRCTEVLTAVGLVRTTNLAATPLRGLRFDIVADVAFAVLSLLLVVVLVNAARHRHSDAAPWTLRAIVMTWALAFVAPFALVRSPLTAAATVAAVHGFHYVFLVAYLSRSRGRRFGWVTSVASGVAAASLYMVVLVHSPAGIGAALSTAVLTTLVAAHRVVDAHVWRLREATQRAYLQRSFNFL